MLTPRHRVRSVLHHTAILVIGMNGVLAGSLMCLGGKTGLEVEMV